MESQTPDPQKGFQSLVIGGIGRARPQCGTVPKNVAAAVRGLTGKTKIDNKQVDFEKDLGELKLKLLVNDLSRN